MAAIAPGWDFQPLIPGFRYTETVGNSIAYGCFECGTVFKPIESTELASCREEHEQETGHRTLYIISEAN